MVSFRSGLGERRLARRSCGPPLSAEPGAACGAGQALAGARVGSARAGRRWWIGLVAGLWVGVAAAGQTGDLNAMLDRCIAAQTNLHTWSAGLTQTRSLQVLAQPLVATGKVWMAMPDRFRWELGQPAQTIALRQPGQLVIVYPRLKRAEKFSLRDNPSASWKEVLALLDASFPRSRAELESHFTVLSLSETNATLHLALQPKSSFARKLIREIRLGLSTQSFCPVSTELRFSDGSTMRNDFVNAVTNAALPEGIFDLKLGPDVTVVEPLRP